MYHGLLYGSLIISFIYICKNSWYFRGLVHSNFGRLILSFSIHCRSSSVFRSSTFNVESFEVRWILTVWSWFGLDGPGLAGWLTDTVWSWPGWMPYCVVLAELDDLLCGPGWARWLNLLCSPGWLGWLTVWSWLGWMTYCVVLVWLDDLLCAPGLAGCLTM